MQDDFFIGWAGRLPHAHRALIPLAAVCFIAAFALLPLAFARATDDPGGGDFDWAAGEQTVTGTLTAHPYPTLWLAPDAAHPAGHTLLLSGLGKSGPDLPPNSDGRRVQATGLMLKRGPLDMLQVDGEPKLLDGAATAPPSTPLGRWRISGEICDGKCNTGAMRPGRGLAHRACADLCVIGGIPPVLVSTGPVEGSEFFLLGNSADTALPDRARDLMALPVTLEGTVERRGDLLILRANLP